LSGGLAQKLTVFVDNEIKWLLFDHETQLISCDGIIDKKRRKWQETLGNLCRMCCIDLIHAHGDDGSDNYNPIVQVM
jgi:hypothetical protein